MYVLGAYFFSKKYDLTLPPVIVAYATQLPFVIGLMGITYGILSSSWDTVLHKAVALTSYILYIMILTIYSIDISYK